jgi:hypothetical protein
MLINLLSPQAGAFAEFTRFVEALPAAERPAAEALLQDHYGLPFFRSWQAWRSHNSIKDGKAPFWAAAPETQGG